MKFYGKSDVGIIRHENQDSFGIYSLLPGVTLCVVCDGMGGYAGGSLASKTALEAFVAMMRETLIPDNPAAVPDLSERSVRNALTASADAANYAVFSKAREKEDGSLNGMGTTLNAVLITDSGFAWSVNVGDSRLYRVFSDRLTQLTRDHSMVQEMVDKGAITAEDATHSPIRNIITRAVGVDTYVDADIIGVDTSPENGEAGYLMICSDGLYTCVPAEKILSVLSSGNTIAKKADRLVSAARKAGGPDNITVLLIEL